MTSQTGLITGAGGGKGGGKGHTPTEAANTLQSKAIARVVDLISEGEIVGLYTGEGADGKEFPFKAIYFNNIPVQSSDGDYIDSGLSEPEKSHWTNLTGLNFEGVEMWERVGLPDQDAIPEFSEVESEITVNEQVTDASPVLFTIADNDVDAIRLKMRLPALYEQTDKGDLVQATLQWTVEVQPSGGSYTEIRNITVTGKNTSPYEDATRIQLGDLGAFPLQFKVTRVTPDSDKASKQQDLFVNSYTEIQEANLSHPNSALVAIKVDSELFSGRVPKRSFNIRGIKIKVPSNYFPETRLYHRNVSTGADMGTDQAWDGLFYTAWSNNPAWVLYDVLTNDRYGLGEFLTELEQVDRFALYSIGQYCDELIDDGLGLGTTEPRFVFNGVINTREDAYDVVNAITSTFRGMSFWSAGGVTAVGDSPKDPVRLVTRANVIDGRFTYSGTSLRSQHSAAVVSWNDPNNNYKQTIEVVEDAVRRRKYKWRPIEVAAFATTSRGQAHRLGRWILDSETNESETLNFSGGLEMADMRPGDIIQVADPARQGVRRAGRVIEYTSGVETVELDEAVVVRPGDTLLVHNVDGGIESVAIDEETVAVSLITLSSAPSADIQPNSVYVHRGNDLVPEEWRVISVGEAEIGIHDITCLTYDSTKYARIEQGYYLEAPPTSFLPTGPLLPATNLTVFESLYVNGTSVNVRVDISWTSSTDPRVQLYKVEVLPPDQQWQLVELTPAPHAEIPNGFAGDWSFRVTAQKGDDGIASNSQSEVLELLDVTLVGKTAPPPNVQNLTADRGFDNVVLDWDDVDDLDLAGYEVRSGAAGTGWDNATVEVTMLVASTYQIKVATADSQVYLVKAVDTVKPTPNYSSRAASITTTVQALQAVAGLVGHQVDDGIRLSWVGLDGVDNIGYDVRYGETTGTLVTANELGRVASPEFTSVLPVIATKTLRFYVRPFVELEGGNISFGTEATVDVELFPLAVGFLVHSSTQETAWSALGAGVASRWLGSGPPVDDTYSSSGVTIRSIQNWNDSYVGGKRIDGKKNGVWRCTLNLSGGTPTGNVLKVGGTTGEGAMGLGFDSSGNLIWRVGQGRHTWDQWDQTNFTHYWKLRESSGSRADTKGSNTLSQVGTVGEGVRQYGAKSTQGVTTSLFESSTPSYLTGTDISVAGGSWGMMLEFNPNSSFDWTGHLFELGDGNSLSVEMISSTVMRVTVQDATGTVTVDSTAPFALSTDQWEHCFVQYNAADQELQVGLGRTNANAVTLDVAGPIDAGSGSLRIGRNFDGSIDNVRWFDRHLGFVDGDDLEEMESHWIDGTIGNMRIEVPNASIPTSTDFEVTFDIDKGDYETTDGSAPAHGRLWINDTLFEADEESGLGYSQLRATVSGKYAAATSAWPGEDAVTFSTPTNFTFETDLDYWYDQTVVDPLEVSGDSLTLADGSIFGVYDFAFDLPSSRIGRFWFEMAASSIAADPLDIFDATMLIDDLAAVFISESTDQFDPQVTVLIDLGNTGTFVPFVLGTYQFEQATIRIQLLRGLNELTRPAVDSFSAYFIEKPIDLTLQAATSDATQTTLTTDGGAVTASNIPTIPDDFTAEIRGTVTARKSDNSELAEFDYFARLKRGTGAASTTVDRTEIVEDVEDGSTWTIDLVANTTHGGLEVRVTGEASTDIKWLNDIDIRKIG